MKIITILITPLIALPLIAVGLFAVTPIVFDGRAAPGLHAGLYTLTGVSQEDIPSVVAAYAKEIANQTITFTFQDHQASLNLRDLGISLDQDKVIQTIQSRGVIDAISDRSIKPVLVYDDKKLNQQLSQAFTDQINSPVNATILINAADKLELVPSQPGEVVNLEQLKADIYNSVTGDDSATAPIILSLSEGQAEIQDNETMPALAFANRLLSEGFELRFGEQVINIKPFTIKRLMKFTEQIDPDNHANLVLGVKFDSTELSNYLQTTIAPDIDQLAQNARFVLADDRVEQFALPRQGQELNLSGTAGQIASKLAKHERTAQIVVNITQPAFSDTADIKELGLTTKLATGESDFAGSPVNRVHNIKVGADKYHGLLIPPATEFSFNEFLGPVTAAAGYKPELVIKENITTPEFGGGLCQVSTTLFRAALNAGLEITQRRNHSYAVSYYGEPGLDATIYPPYTDLRFLNNTPGYILIQTRIDGTKLAFDLWGTDDGREVNIIGPIAYDKKTDGSVKAYVDQRVTLAGEVIIDTTFYSRYKSPKLFPRVLAANGEASPQAGEASPAASAETVEPATSTAPPAPPADATPSPKPLTTNNNDISKSATPKPAQPSTVQPEASNE